MRREFKLYLHDVVTRCRKIRQFTVGFDEEAYSHNEMARWAAERAFIVIGEALVCAGRMTPDLIDRLPNAGSVIGFRNFLVHNYLKIDEALVWEIIQFHVPALQAQCEEWLAELGENTDV